jgi:hypothetical protein
MVTASKSPHLPYLNSQIQLVLVFSNKSSIKPLPTGGAVVVGDSAPFY